jgi:hypothetical protein
LSATTAAVTRCQRRLALWAAGSAVVVASCGISASGPVERIPDDAVQFDLNRPTTTSTTTTTAAPPLQLPTTVPDSSTTTLPTEAVELFFITRGGIAALQTPLVGVRDASTLVVLLQAGPPDDAVGLRSALPGTDIEMPAVTDGSGVATVELPLDFFERVTGLDQRLAVAQVVLTLLANLPGVGQVRFVQDGVAIEVQRGDGTQAPAGESLTLLDYESLLQALPGTPSASTSTSDPLVVSPDSTATSSPPTT